MLLLLFRTVAAAGESLDPVEIARKSMLAVADNRTRARQYAFREYTVRRDVDKSGRETDRETQTWDIIGLEGSTYRKLVMRNDRPLSGKEQKREDERLRKEAERRRHENADERKRRLFSLTYNYVLPYEKLVEMCDLRFLRADEVAGRPAWVIAASPRSAFQPVTDHDRESMNYRFVLWVDQAEFFPARIEGEIVGEHSRLEKGSTFRHDEARLSDGTWMPKTQTFRYAARIAKLFDARGEQEQLYSDFRRFAVESNIVAAGEKR